MCPSKVDQFIYDDSLDYYRDHEISDSPAFSATSIDCADNYHQHGLHWTSEVMGAWFINTLLAHYLYRVSGLYLKKNKIDFEMKQQFFESTPPDSNAQLERILSEIKIPEAKEEKMKLLTHLAKAITKIEQLIALGAEFQYLRVLSEKANRYKFTPQMQTQIETRGGLILPIIYNWVKYFVDEMTDFIQLYEGNLSDIRTHVEEFKPHPLPLCLKAKLDVIYQGENSYPKINMDLIPIGSVNLKQIWVGPLQYTEGLIDAKRRAIEEGDDLMVFSFDKIYRRDQEKHASKECNRICDAISKNTAVREPVEGVTTRALL